MQLTWNSRVDWNLDRCIRRSLHRISRLAQKSTLTNHFARFTFESGWSCNTLNTLRIQQKSFQMDLMIPCHRLYFSYSQNCAWSLNQSRLDTSWAQHQFWSTNLDSFSLYNSNIFSKLTLVDEQFFIKDKSGLTKQKELKNQFNHSAKVIEALLLLSSRSTLLFTLNLFKDPHQLLCESQRLFPFANDTQQRWNTRLVEDNRAAECASRHEAHCGRCHWYRCTSKATAVESMIFSFRSSILLLKGWWVIRRRGLEKGQGQRFESQCMAKFKGNHVDVPVEVWLKLVDWFG